jgi:hypothetical protein
VSCCEIGELQAAAGSKEKIIDKIRDHRCSENKKQKGPIAQTLLGKILILKISEQKSNNDERYGMSAKRSAGKNIQSKPDEKTCDLGNELSARNDQKCQKDHGQIRHGSANREKAARQNLNDHQ